MSQVVETGRMVNNFSGYGANLVRLDPEIADQFMQVADMKGDVVLTDRLPTNVRLSSGHPAALIKSGLDWHINIQGSVDKAMSKKLTGESPDVVAAGISKDLSFGLSKALFREKFLNSDKYSMAFWFNYWAFLAFEAGSLPKYIYEFAHSEDPTLVVAKAVKAWAIVNIVGHSSNLFLTRRLTRDLEGVDLPNHPMLNLINDPREPFLRRSVPEMVLAPLVPVDKFAQGALHLALNRKKFIQPVA